MLVEARRGPWDVVVAALNVPAWNEARFFSDCYCEDFWYLPSAWGLPAFRGRRSRWCQFPN